jgi:hypothetical protein
MSRPVTLNPSNPLVFMLNNLNAYGAVALYGKRDVFAAVFGFSASVFTVDNVATITSKGDGFGEDAGIVLGQAGTVYNSGAITGGGGVFMFGKAAGSGVYNYGLIAGTSTGVYFQGGGGWVFNYGVLSGFIGIKFERGGYVYNSGTIIGQQTAIDIAGTNASQVFNKGLVLSSQNYESGVFLQAGGSVQNSGSIFANGYSDGVRASAALTLNNSGVIAGDDDGVAAAGGATLVSTGSITGRYDAVLVSGTAYISNAGTIAGLQLGVDFGGGTLLNNGVITGNAAALEVYGGVTISNFGALTANGAFFGQEYGIAVALRQGGILTNEPTGLIQADEIAVYGAGQPAELFNVGVMTGASYAVLFEAGGYVYNNNRISGQTAVQIAGSYAYVYNTGLIASSGGDGLSLLSAGTVLNTGTLRGSVYGAVFAAGGTLDNTGLIQSGAILAQGTMTNAGTIIARGAAPAIEFESAASRLILSPTSLIIGEVLLGGGRLELGSGAVTGTLAYSELSNAKAITIDAGARWDFSDTAAVTQTITNNGTIKLAAADNFSSAAPLLGTGAIDLGSRPVILAASVASGQRMVFNAAGETLELGNPQQFAGTIAGFTLGETIDLTSLSFTTTAMSFAAGILTVTAPSATVTLTFASPASFGKDVFSSFDDAGAIGLMLTTQAAAAVLEPPSAGAASTASAAARPAATGWLGQNLLATLSATSIPAMTLGL